MVLVLIGSNKLGRKTSAIMTPGRKEQNQGYRPETKTTSRRPGHINRFFSFCFFPPCANKIFLNEATLKLFFWQELRKKISCCGSRKVCFCFVFVFAVG